MVQHTKANISSIADRVQQLSCIKREHFIHVAPTNVALEPPVKKRKMRKDTLKWKTQIALFKEIDCYRRMYASR